MMELSMSYYRSSSSVRSMVTLPFNRLRKTRVILLAASAAVAGMSLPSTTAFRLPSFGRVLKFVPQRGPYGLSLTGKNPPVKRDHGPPAKGSASLIGQFII